ncbi:hypothetical protein DOY81_012115, partial [Sarcophaga bullata]
QKYHVKQVFNIHRFRNSELTSELRKTPMESTFLISTNDITNHKKHQTASQSTKPYGEI